MDLGSVVVQKASFIRLLFWLFLPIFYYVVMISRIIIVTALPRWEAGWATKQALRLSAEKLRTSLKFINIYTIISSQKKRGKDDLNLTSFFGKTFSLEKGLISLYLRLKMWQYNSIVYDDVEHQPKKLQSSSEKISSLESCGPTSTTTTSNSSWNPVQNLPTTSMALERMIWNKRFVPWAKYEMKLLTEDQSTVTHTHTASSSHTERT